MQTNQKSTIFAFYALSVLKNVIKSNKF